MGINEQTAAAGNIVSVKYSANFGGLYKSTLENDQAILAIKAELTEAACKKGFDGLKGNSISSQFRAKAKAAGITPVSISGRLSSVKLVEKDSPTSGKQYYVRVSLRDDDTVVYLSIDVKGQGAQMMVRKLSNAVIGEETSINLFATMGEKYADHGASVKQLGKEVKGISPTEALQPKVVAALEALKAAGVDDKETLSKRRAVVTAEYHKVLCSEVEQNFALHYADREAAKDAAGHADDADAGADGDDDL